MQDNGSSEARDRRKVAGYNSLKEGGKNRGAKGTVIGGTRQKTRRRCYKC
jgi:hypothetical protein